MIVFLSFILCPTFTMSILGGYAQICSVFLFCVQYHVVSDFPSCTDSCLSYLPRHNVYTEHFARKSKYSVTLCWLIS